MIKIVFSNNRDDHTIETKVPYAHAFTHLDPYLYRYIIDYISEYASRGIQVRISAAPDIIQTKLNF